MKTKPNTPMPATAEQAHAVARQWYRAMLAHADSGRDLQAGTAAACFQNACALAQMYELRNIRIALMRQVTPRPPADTSWVQSTEDSHELHPTARSDGLPVDERASYAVPGRRSA